MGKEKVTTKKKRKKVHNKKKDLPFLEHLEELRWHLIRAIISIIIFAITAFAFKEFIFDEIIFKPRDSDFITNRLLCQLGDIIGSSVLCINSTELTIINIKMAGQFLTHIKVSIVVGLILAFPYVFWEVWRFIKPALKSKEKGVSRGAVFWSSLLFIIGVLFGYFIVTPLSVNFFTTYFVSKDVTNQINLTSYIGIITSVVLSGGAIFELPVLIYILSKAGLVSSSSLKKYRRHSIIIVLVLSAMITPPDIFSQVLVAFPLFFLYEIGIIISKRIEKKRIKQYGF